MSQAAKSNQPMHTGWHAGGRFSVVPMFSFPGYPEVRQVPEGGSLLSSTGLKGLGVSFLSFVTVELTCCPQALGALHRKQGPGEIRLGGGQLGRRWRETGPPPSEGPSRP